MGINLASKDLERTLERAVRLAESDTPLPDEWTERTVYIAECPSQTYVAALGVALLAKATNPDVDALTVKASVSPNAYSMRGSAKVLARRARDYGYHLGVTRPEPLNNQPWFGGDRIDRFTRLGAGVPPFHNAFVRYMRELNGYRREDALAALAAFVRERIRYTETHTTQEEDDAAQPESMLDLARALEAYIRERPERGRRGQALVAAVLDAGGIGSVTTGAVHHPRGNDVQLLRDASVVLGLEAKQKPVDAGVALTFADELRRAGVDKGVLVALAPEQQPLDRPFLLAEAERRSGVTLTVIESVDELLSVVATWSPAPAREVLAAVPANFRLRLRELGVSEEGLAHWLDVEAGLEVGSTPLQDRLL